MAESIRRLRDEIDRLRKVCKTVDKLAAFQETEAEAEGWGVPAMFEIPRTTIAKVRAALCITPRRRKRRKTHA